MRHFLSSLLGQPPIPAIERLPLRVQSSPFAGSLVSRRCHPLALPPRTRRARIRAIPKTFRTPPTKQKTTTTTPALETPEIHNAIAENSTAELLRAMQEELADDNNASS
ncbi:MAG: hypothetical protein FJ096_17375 [Deltaproteobacteria bacterium]|nr:hypothetical protein [Deltaproteobacteria bacterium]